MSHLSFVTFKLSWRAFSVFSHVCHSTYPIYRQFRKFRNYDTEVRAPPPPWQGDTQGCKRGQLCRYLHDQSKERMEENCEEEGVGTISANQNEDVNPTEKFKELEEELVSKQKEVEAKLTAENEIMKRLVEKLKRVTTNMSKEIEHLKSTRS